jgi:predicted DNA binding CopG/RHH family protein
LFAVKRKVPEFRSDDEAAAFLEQDLSDLDFTRFKPAHFAFEKKTVQVNMRLSKSLLDVVKQRSAARGISYTRFIREALEKALAGTDPDIANRAG